MELSLAFSKSRRDTECMGISVFVASLRKGRSLVHSSARLPLKIGTQFEQFALSTMHSFLVQMHTGFFNLMHTVLFLHSAAF